MKTVKNVFVTETKEGKVVQVGKSMILQPEIHFQGGSVKWFDDNLLRKKNIL